MIKDLWGRVLSLVAIASLAIVMTACREDEQNRPMTKQKGVYEGPVDEKLDETDLEDLRTRASGQKF